MTPFERQQIKEIYDRAAISYMVRKLINFVSDDDRELLYKEAKEFAFFHVTTNGFNAELDAADVLQEVMDVIKKSLGDK